MQTMTIYESFWSFCFEEEPCFAYSCLFCFAFSLFLLAFFHNQYLSYIQGIIPQE
jgi:hypothetical protein